jgi:signal transduction histidine kinase/ActR/RegA family two-component response regulator
MKNLSLFLMLLLLFSSRTVNARKTADSLRTVIHSDTASDMTRLRTYEKLFNHLLHIDLEEAREICKEAIDLAKAVDNFVFESVMTTSIGITYYYQGEFEITAKYWLKALAISEKAKDSSRIMQIYTNLGSLYDNMEEYDKSMEFNLKSYQMKLKAGDRESIAITELNIGKTFHKMGQYDSARRYHKRAIDVFEDYSNRKGLATAYNNLGSVNMATKDYKNALDSYEKANEFKDQLRVYDQAVLLMNMGALFFEHLNEAEQGKAYLELSLDLANKHNLLRVRQNVYEVYYYNYYLQGDYKNAYEYQEKYIMSRDSLFTIEKDAEIKRLQTVYDFEKKEQENLALSQEMEIRELENFRKTRTNQALMVIIFLGLIVLVIILVLLSKVNKAKRKADSAQAELEKTNKYLKKAKTEVERSLEFKNQFLANMSHEVRTPLNVIIGFNSNLKRKVDDPKLKQYIEAIETSSYSLLNLLNDVLDMSKIEAGKVILHPVNTNLKLLIAEIHTMFNLGAKDKNIEFEYHYQDSLPEYFHLDQVLLRQVIVNIVGNAIKFTHHGKVRIDVMEEERKSGHYASSLKNLCIVIKDTGIGIKPEDQKSIFNSFVQAKGQDNKEYGGTGLGLAISKKFAELLGGDIILESKPGEGSTFKVFLRNVTEGQPEAIEFKKERLHANPQGIEFTGGTLLVADDEPLNRNMVQSFFEDTPVKVVLAENGKELIAKAREVNPAVILSDIKMPYINGIEAAKIMKSDEKLKDIPIIAFTASILFPNMDKKERQLFAGYIPKPADINEIYERLSFYLPVSEVETVT